MTQEPVMTVGVDGTKRWWVNGQQHRTDGPAAEYVNGYYYWWLNGREYTLEEYCRELYGEDWEQHYLWLKLKYG